MIRPDCIVSWPVNCDYPLWRLFIRESRDRFDKVIIVFTQAPTGKNYHDFVVESMFKDKVITVWSPDVGPGQDWRDVAVKHGLTFSESEWVWFTEQDFYPNAKFFEMTISPAFKVRAVYQGDRLHPCSILIERKLLDSLKLDFGIIPGVADHFARIQQQLEALKVPIVKVPETHYLHFNGLSHNWRLVTEGQPAVYQSHLFLAYLQDCLEAPINLDDEFKRVAQNAILDANDAGKEANPPLSPTEK